MDDVLIGEIAITQSSLRPIKRFEGTLFYKQKKRLKKRLPCVKGAVSEAD